MKKSIFVILGFIIGVLILSSPAYAQAILTGRVTEKATGDPLPGATIFFPDLKTGTASDMDGNYRMTDLPRSTLLIQVSYVGYKSVIDRIDLSKTSKKNFELEESAIEASEVVITGNAVSSDNDQSSISITPISKTQLLTTSSTNIIDAIANVPGLSQITTGGEISKPVIRGLSYNHVVTINEGVRQEGNQWGDEHGIEIDQFSADRIEVLKGPASLFYGSDAMGGVINILEPIPAAMGTISGELTSQFSTNNRLYSNSLMLEGNQNGFIWRMRGTYKNAASYKTPPEYVYNSGFNETDYSFMLGLNKKWGFTHLHFSAFNTKIGMVEGTRDSLTNQFIDYQGNIVSEAQSKSRTIKVPFQKVSHYRISSGSNFIFGNNQIHLNVGYQDNDREEFDDTPDAPGLYFHLNTWTYDTRYTLSLPDSLELVAGFAGMTQSNRNLGNDFLIPDYDLQDVGGFIYGKKTWKRFTFNMGIRYDHRYVNGKPLYLDSLGHPVSAGDTLFPAFQSNFSAFTGSAGMTFRLNRVFNFKFNIGRGFRAPNIAELGSNGVHEGTFRYEIGNPDLKPETSLQIDGEISAETKYLDVIFNGYYNIINNYIYYRNLNDEKKFVDNQWYPVYRYVQGNSLLKGFEFEVDIHPVEPLHFDNNIDYTWGTNLSTGTPLPYIPALHSQHTLRWTFKTDRHNHLFAPYVEAELEVHYIQDRVDVFESPSACYALLNASAGTRLKVQHQVWTLFISGKNLTNTTYFDHLSRLQDIGIHNMGWNLTAGVVIPFGLYQKKDPVSD
jgi:iron complex outermembrane receptor protein